MPPVTELELVFLHSQNSNVEEASNHTYMNFEPVPKSGPRNAVDSKWTASFSVRGL